MKSIVSTILKVMTALVLAVLMMVGSVSNVVGAIVEQADFGDYGSAVQTAATKALGIASDAVNKAADTDSAPSDDADQAPALDFEENEIVRGMKEDLASVGYSGSIYLRTSKSTSAWTNTNAYSATLNNSNKATFTVDLSTETIDSGYWYFKIVAGSDIFCNGETVGTSGSNLAKNSNGGNNAAKIDVTGNNLTGKTLTLSVDLSSGTIAAVSWTASGGSSSCSTDKTYRLVGTAGIAGTAWANGLAANNLTYSTAVGSYTKSYTNIAAGTNDFRIIEGSTWSTTWGFDRANKVDSAGIVSSFIVKPGSDSDNNIRMTTTQKANITIYFDDSKSDTSAITVVVTPAASTVTAGSVTGGTITVNGGSSASNIAYGGTVNLVATPSANYHFGSWTTNSKLSYNNANNASTTATVTGTTTVQATFVKDSFNISRNTTGNFTITTPSANTTKQWDTSVSVTAKAASGYYVDYLYYLVNDDGNEVKITSGAADSGTQETLSGSFKMPANNVTLYAHVHKRTNYTITYGVTNDSPSGSGYVSVGEYYNSATTIKHTIDSGDPVIEGTKVNFGARPAIGYKFVGWYTNANGTGTADSTVQDNTVSSVSANTTLYAKFEKDTYLNYTGGVNLLIYAGDNNDVYLWAYDHNNSNQQISGVNDWPGKQVSTYSNTVTINSKTYHVFNTTLTNFKFILSLNKNNEDSPHEINGAGTYIVEYVYGTNKPDPSVTNYGSTHSGNRGYATTAYFPVKYYVTNPDKGDTVVYAPTFGEASKNITIYHTPADTTNYKTSRTTTGFSTSANTPTTDTSTSIKMPSSYAECKFTATFVEKDYYKVTFSAGTGGSVTATAGGTAITSGTMVQEGKEVVFTESPASGYSFNGWTGSGTGSGTTRTITSLSGAADVKAYFTKSIGTVNTADYFGYSQSASTDSDPKDWTIVSTYRRDGHVFAYIPSVDSSKNVFIAAYDEDPGSDEWKKYKKQKYYGTDNTVWGSTEFSTYITDITRRTWYYDNDKNANFVRFSVTSDVKALIIDLGPDDGNGNAQTHLADKNHNFLANNYRIIPVFNTDVSKVSIYAKDASYRGNDGYDLLPGIANTVISGSITGRVEHGEFETAVANKGDTITVTTKIDAANKGNYYVRGFSFNGVTPALLEPNTSTGEYSQTYTIPADFDYDYLEITPIYYEVHKDGGEYVSFYIENYDKALEATGWGNTLSVYPYYQDNSGNYAATKSNAFGGYPGQPVIYNGGRRFIEIPTIYNLNSKNYYIKGLTMSNDYFDIVHRDYCREVDDHFQTYDYDDFYKIAKETSDGKEVNHKADDGRDKVADQITFAFKYRTTTNNFSDSSNTATYSNTGKTVKAPYSSFTSAEKTSKFKNGWEPLLDYHDRPIDIFGKQLTTAEQEKDPILVVSDDYAINYVGRYATTWTVYAKNDAGTSYTKIAEIAPSALIVTSDTRLADGNPYPAVSDETGMPSQAKLSSYTTAYNAIKAYKDRPVEITYESAIRNDNDYAKYWSMTGGSSEISKRSDGRWYYSYMNEKINANLRIDYSDDDGATYTTDTFKEDSNKGTVTGATVQFTNTAGDSDGGYALSGLHDTEDYDGDVLSNQNHNFKFVATPGSGYVFAGWWFEKDGKATNVNDDLSKLDGKSQMTSNATFVARYIKNPSGNLTINHTIANGSSGDATTYVGVKAVKGSEAVWLTGAGTEADHFTEDTFTIDNPIYTSYKSGYTFQVWLNTVTNDFTNFNRFSAKEEEGDHSSDYFSTEHQATDGNTTTTYFEVNADDLFELVDSFPVQQFDTLTYYSHLSSKSFGYNFNFTYPAYLSKYGTQGYRVTGTFTYDELKEFMQMSDSTLQFKDATSKTTFLNKIAPYEDNFMQEISWDTSVSTSFSNNTISAVVPAVCDDNKPINVTFRFNYSVSGYTSTGTDYSEDYISVDVPSADRPNHLSTFMPDNAYVTAPQTLTDGTKTMVFRYWSVTTVPDSKHSAVEYTRCYDNEFNFVLFQDAIVSTVYTVQIDETDGYNPFGQQISDENKQGVTISFIENSRNQYNDNQSGNGMSTSRKAMGDRMYTDFLLSYNSVAYDQENGLTFLKNLPTGTKKAGLIIEVVGTIDTVDGKYVTKTEAEYREMYGTTISDIGEKLSGKDTTVDQLQRLKDYITGTNNSNPIRGALSEFDVTSLDNKNRLQYSYSLLNRSHSDLSVGNNRYNVYRAYAYIYDVADKANTIQISDTPVYFTIYDMASIQNYAEANATGGVQ